jgi:putative nucleotidyltransferase with HDIG domain
MSMAFARPQQRSVTGCQKKTRIDQMHADIEKMVDITKCAVKKGMPPKLANVPPFPPVAIELLSLLSNDDTGFDSIVACIATDPVLSAKVINRANAADLANYCEATSVHQAVVALGMDRTRETSLTAAVANYASLAIKRQCLASCWHHTLACALLASEFARQCGKPPVAAYTAGLLHDIGRLGLLTAYPEQYERILATAAEQPVDLLEVERSSFGVDHLEAGVWLAREWRLPESLVEVIVLQGQPPSGVLNEATLVQVACQFADFLGLSAQACHTTKSFAEIAAPLPEGTRARIQAQLPAMKAAILKEIGLAEAAGESDSGDSKTEDANSIAGELPPETCASPSPRSSGILVTAVVIVALMLLAGVWFLRR